MLPDDIAYLCSVICSCNCDPVISNKGRELRQRCATIRVRNDCDAHEQVWKYKGEIGYNMINNPPSPIMAALRKNQPLQFPLGVDTKALEAAVDLAKLTGRAQKGLLRIPDVVIVKNMRDFDLSQPNIEFVVEIKFPGDDWQPGQEEDYADIAGGFDRLKLLSPKACECKPCGERKKVPVAAALPEKAVAPDMTRQLSRIRSHNTGVDLGTVPGPKFPEPQMLSDVLLTGARVVGTLGIAFLAVTFGPELLALVVIGGLAAE